MTANHIASQNQYHGKYKRQASFSNRQPMRTVLKSLMLSVVVTITSHISTSGLDTRPVEREFWHKEKAGHKHSVEYTDIYAKIAM